jgi:hypothetical protein
MQRAPARAPTHNHGNTSAARACAPLLRRPPPRRNSRALHARGMPALHAHAPGLLAVGLAQAPCLGFGRLSRPTGAAQAGSATARPNHRTSAAPGAAQERAPCGSHRGPAPLRSQQHPYPTAAARRARPRSCPASTLWAARRRALLYGPRARPWACLCALRVFGLRPARPEPARSPLPRLCAALHGAAGSAGSS